MILRNFTMALASLAQNKLRSFLTMLGIIIGVASVITVIAVGEGVKEEVSSSITDLGSNLINISPGQTISTDEDGQQIINPIAGLGASTLTAEDVTTIENIDGIEIVAPLGFISGVPSKEGEQAQGALIIATTPSIIELLNQEVADGRFFEISELEAEEPVFETVIGQSVAEALFSGTDPLDQTITIRGEEFTVVGIMEAEEETAAALTTGPDLGSSVYIPFATATEITGSSNITEINAKASDNTDVEEVAEAIRAALRQNHGGEEDFTVLTQDDILSVFDTIVSLLTNFISAIAAISLLVGGIGVANIMLVSVTERTREIGIRKAVGATRWHILLQFLIEAIVLSITGGIIGVAVAFGLTQVIEAQANISAVFTPFAFVLALGVSGLVGVIFGIAPAIKAARKNPIQALRYE